MLCPVCRNNMKVRKHKGVHVDVCDSCGGVWLDTGEIDTILDKEGFRDAGFGLKKKPLETVDVKPGEKPCPLCSMEMAIARFPNVTKLRVDRCPNGHGLWFDEGELKVLRVKLERRRKRQRRMSKNISQRFREEQAERETNSHGTSSGHPLLDLVVTSLNTWLEMRESAYNQNKVMESRDRLRRKRRRGKKR